MSTTTDHAVRLTKAQTQALSCEDWYPPSDYTRSERALVAKL